MALIAILPPARMLNDGDILRLIDLCRPHSVLPYHPEPEPEDLAVVLRRPPEALPVDVVDYLTWRGIRVDGDTRQLIRRTVELSSAIRTVSGLARALYLSRRALGRRFLTRGLPAPSHWLQFGRALRAAIRLQSTDDNLFTIATDLGYPDGFALSNQMKRLLGARPSTIRDCLGWEWVVEAWLRAERQAGTLRFDIPIDLGSPIRRVAEAGPAGPPVRPGPPGDGVLERLRAGQAGR
jgi:AraC-like DNA-binding protein